MLCYRTPGSQKPPGSANPKSKKKNRILCPTCAEIGDPGFQRAFLIGLARCTLGSLVMVCRLLTQGRGGGSLWLLKAMPLHKRCSNSGGSNKELTTLTTKKTGSQLSQNHNSLTSNIECPRSSAGDQTHFETMCHCRYLLGVLK